MDTSAGTLSTSDSDNPVVEFINSQLGAVPPSLPLNVSHILTPTSETIVPCNNTPITEVADSDDHSHESSQPEQESGSPAPNGFTDIGIPERHTDEANNSTPNLSTQRVDRIRRYVHTTLLLMFYTGQSSFMPGTETHLETQKWQKAFCLTQKIVFWIFNMITFWILLNRAKIFLLQFFAYRELDDLVTTVVFVTCLAVHLHTISVILFRQNHLSRLLKKFEEYEQSWQTRSHESYDNSESTIVVVHGMLSITCSVIKVVFIKWVRNWTFNELLLHFSAKFNFAFLLWSPYNISNFTMSIKQNVNNEQTVTTFIAGWSELLANIVTEIRLDMIRDLLLFLAIVNKNQVCKLTTKCAVQIKRKLSRSATSTIERDIELWERYRDLKDLILETNDLIDGILNLMHFYNFLSLTLLLVETLNTEVDMPAIITAVINVAKMTGMYLFARMSSNQNNTCQDWIEGLPCYTNRFMVGNVHTTRPAMQLELTKCPLGFGSFVINNSFLLNFLLVVLSLFGVLIGLHDFG